MAFIDPKQGKAHERDPNEGNIPTGMYQCELTRVAEAPPSAKFPNGNSRLVFEFTVRGHAQRELNGRNAIVFLGKTLLKNREGRESNLVKWARMMGVANPEKGFDPETLVGKMFTVMVEYTPGTGEQAGRAWARQAIAAGGAPPAQQSATNANAAPQQHASNPAAKWDISDGTSTQRGLTSVELQEFINTNPKAFEALQIKPGGAPHGTAVGTPKEYGFSDVIPF